MVLTVPDESLYDDNNYDMPRPLTGEEREDVLSVLRDEKIVTIHPDITEVLLQQHINSIRIQMETFELCPSLIPNLKGWLINQHFRAMGDPKEPVGLNTAESISAPLTQINLNSFHSSGYAKNMSIEGFKEIYNASVERKTPISEIHFKQKDLTVEEVVELRTKIVGITIGDLILGKPQILKVADIDPKDYWWINAYDISTGKTFDDIEYYLQIKFNTNMLYAYNVTLYDIIMIIERQSQSDEQNICYIRSSPMQMAEIHIYAAQDKVMSAIINSLSEKQSRITNYIDNPLILFYDYVIVPDIKNLIVKGVPNISGIVPVFYNTLDVILYQEPLANKYNFDDLMKPFTESIITFDGDKITEQILREADVEMQLVRDTATFEDLSTNVWKLWVDTRKLLFLGINIDKLGSLLEECGIKFQEYEVLEETSNDPYYYNLIKMPKNWKEMLEINPGKRDFVIVRMPEKWGKEMTNYYDVEILKQAKKSGKGWRSRLKIIKAEYKKEFAPLAYIRMKLQLDKENTANKIQKDESNAIKVKKPQDFKTKLNRASTYVFAEAIGSNLKHLLAHPLVDPDLTISNNYHEVLESLGIEVTRNCIAQELYAMIDGGGSAISSRHIQLIADVMTSSGSIVPITSRGATKQRRGVVTDITFQDAIKTAVQGAILAKDENNRSASTQIFQGKRIELGTGGVNFTLRPEVLNLLIDVELQIAQTRSEPIRMIHGVPVPGKKGETSEDLREAELFEEHYDDGMDRYVFSSANADKMGLIKDGYGESIDKGYSFNQKQPLPEFKTIPTKIDWLEVTFSKLLYENLFMPSLKNITKDILLKKGSEPLPIEPLQYVNPQILVNILHS